MKTLFTPDACAAFLAFLFGPVIVAAFFLHVAFLLGWLALWAILLLWQARSPQNPPQRDNVIPLRRHMNG